MSATTRPPSSLARAAACNWRGTRSGSRESTVSTFQFIGLFAAALILASRSISSSENVSRQPGTIPSRVVPGYFPVSSQSAMSSSCVAQRLATGSPSPSECDVELVKENPSAPASIAFANSARMPTICSASAGFPTASSPIAYRRIAQCPTKKPAFTAMLPSKRCKKSANVSHDQSVPCSSAGNGIPSTFDIILRK